MRLSIVGDNAGKRQSGVRRNASFTPPYADGSEFCA
jgi:hypothetical protein